MAEDAVYYGTLYIKRDGSYAIKLVSAEEAEVEASNGFDDDEQFASVAVDEDLDPNLERQEIAQRLKNEKGVIVGTHIKNVMGKYYKQMCALLDYVDEVRSGIVVVEKRKDHKTDISEVIWILKRSKKRRLFSRVKPLERLDGLMHCCFGDHENPLTCANCECICHEY